MQVRFDLDRKVEDNEVFTMSSISTFAFERGIHLSRRNHSELTVQYRKCYASKILLA